MSQLIAERPDHVGALDYQFDVTTARRTIKTQHVSDEFTLESLCGLVDCSIEADATLAVLDKLVTARSTHPPHPLRSSV